MPNPRNILLLHITVVNNLAHTCGSLDAKALIALVRPALEMEEGA